MIDQFNVRIKINCVSPLDKENHDCFFLVDFGTRVVVHRDANDEVYEIWKWA